MAKNMKEVTRLISVREASKISGYHQDYISSLIRKGQIRGEKIGRNWVTTTEEIDLYIDKAKSESKLESGPPLVRGFLSYVTLGMIGLMAVVTPFFVEVINGSEEVVFSNNEIEVAKTLGDSVFNRAIDFSETGSKEAMFD